MLTTAVVLSGCPDDSNNTNNTNNTSSDMSADMDVKEDMNLQKDMNVQKDMAQDLSEDMSDMTTSSDMCTDKTVYLDGDGDGYGVEATSMMVCLKPGEPAQDGYALEKGDCSDSDPLQHEQSEGVCGDNVDDNCDGKDEACPTSMPAQMNIPNWDCTGAPPSNVYAWAKFDDGKGYFQSGGCFIFFQGNKNAFYVKRTNIERTNQDPSCDTRNGCTCPSLNGWPSYDRRLYAMTRSNAEQCPEVSLRDHAGEEQAVSNACRKYLYQMHFYEIDYSFVASDVNHLARRLDAFPTVEIACLEDAPHRNLPYATLLTFPIQKNPEFKPLQ